MMGIWEMYNYLTQIKKSLRHREGKLLTTYVVRFTWTLRLLSPLAHPSVSLSHDWKVVGI